MIQTENNSWVKLHRKFLEWGWYDDINTSRLFLHLLLRANYKNKVWHGININRGQLLTSLTHLSEETGLSVQNIRTSITKLKSTQELTRETSRYYTLLTVVNYDKYQSNQHTEQQMANTRLTTTKESKKESIHICSFQEFWKKYPKKVSKKKAEAVYESKATSKKAEDLILQGLEKYINKWKIEKTDEKYIPNPTTWLNQERWEDDVVISRGSFNKNAREFENKWQGVKTKERDSYQDRLVDNGEGGLVKLSEILGK